MTATDIIKDTNPESFAALFEESMALKEMRQGEIITAEVISVESDFVTVSAGLKSESIIRTEEFLDDKGSIEVVLGDHVKVAIEKIEDGYGSTILSRVKAKQMQAWIDLEDAMDNILKQLPKKAKDKEKENRKLFKKLRKKPPNNLDNLMVELHDKEFAKTDCLKCANCCKTTAPWLTDHDVARIAKHLKLKEQKFIEEYLEVGEDNEFSFKLVPCVFLMPDNECGIYNVRPKACREYPHTNRRKFQQIETITIENTAICPATYNIMEALKANLPIQYSEKGGKPREKFRRGGG